MIQLDSGNVLLKPAQRKQLMSRLKRSMQLGDRLGQFVLKLKLRRQGKILEIVATVQDLAGNFACKIRQATWPDALHELVNSLRLRIHNQSLQRMTVRS